MAERAVLGPFISIWFQTHLELFLDGFLDESDETLKAYCSFNNEESIALNISSNDRVVFCAEAFEVVRRPVMRSTLPALCPRVAQRAKMTLSYKYVVMVRSTLLLSSSLDQKPG